MTKRNIFAELIEGFDALEGERTGKVTLKTTFVESLPVPAMSGADVRHVRAKLNVSQSVFARQLRIAERTVANWEQGVSQPNAQAVILIRLIERHPALLQEIATL
jgi:putative transcriptional regulator